MNIRVLISLIFLTFNPLLHAQKNEADSLKALLETTTDSTVMVDALNQLSFYYRVSDPDSAILLGKQSAQIARAFGYDKGLAHSKTRRAIAHTSLGNYYQALQLFLDAKVTYEANNDTASIASCLNNMARVYNAIEENDRALANFKKASELFHLLGDLEREGSGLNNIGYIYKLKAQYDSAHYYLGLARKRAISLNDRRAELYPIYNIGSTYMLQNVPDSAFKYLDNAIELAKNYRDEYVISLALLDLGRMHLKLNQYEEAENKLLKAYENSAIVGLRAQRRDAANYLSMVYEQKGQLKSALAYQRNFKAINDSLFNKDLARRMAFQEAEYQFNRQRIQEEIERREEELEQTRILTNAIWMRNTLTIGFLIMVLIAYLLYKNFTRKRKANEQLMLLNQQIEAQAAELKNVNKEITVMNNNLEKIVNRRTQELKEKNKKLQSYLTSYSHIVRAPLARILGLVDLYDPNNHENLDFITDSLHKSATELDDALRKISESLSDD